MKRISKALAAAGSALVAALVAALATEVPRTRDGWIAIAGAAVGLGVAAGYATYWAPANQVKP